MYVAINVAKRRVKKYSECIDWCHSLQRLCFCENVANLTPGIQYNKITSISIYFYKNKSKSYTFRLPLLQTIPGTLSELGRVSAMLFLLPGMFIESDILGSSSSLAHFPDENEIGWSSAKAAFSWGLLLDIFCLTLLCKPTGILAERPGSPIKENIQIGKV